VPFDQSDHRVAVDANRLSSLFRPSLSIVVVPDHVGASQLADRRSIDPPRSVSNSVAAAAGRASYLTEQIPLLGRLIPLLGAKIPLFGSAGDFQSGLNKINSLEGF
jgi:hypothetical protein